MEGVPPPSPRLLPEPPVSLLAAVCGAGTFPPPPHQQKLPRASGHRTTHGRTSPAADPRTPCPPGASPAHVSPPSSLLGLCHCFPARPLHPCPRHGPLSLTQPLHHQCRGNKPRSDPDICLACACFSSLLTYNAQGAGVWSENPKSSSLGSRREE